VYYLSNLIFLDATVQTRGVPRDDFGELEPKLCRTPTQKFLAYPEIEKILGRDIKYLGF